MCDGFDNNCDTVVDEGFDVGAACTDGIGACAVVGVEICTVDGTGMLLHQGALAFSLWTGRRAPIAVMARALRQVLANAR